LYRIIVALDRVENLHRAVSLVDSLCGHVAGFKIGLPFVLTYGAASASRLRSLCPRSLWVADFKLADIGEVMIQTVAPILGYVDAVIAHSFVGRRGALDILKDELDKKGKKLVLVATMSHPGATEVYDRVLDVIEEIVDELKPWGLVAPATRPEIVERLHNRHPWAEILSPGVGAQGAEPGVALCRGASYEIIGRAITRAEDPVSAVTEIGEAQKEALRRCGKA
jgi:orotidine-5'-phosphate decarboxylase